jgi:hypothetical protein
LTLPLERTKFRLHSREHCSARPEQGGLFLIRASCPDENPRLIVSYIFYGRNDLTKTAKTAVRFCIRATVILMFAVLLYFPATRYVTILVLAYAFLGFVFTDLFGRRLFMASNIDAVYLLLKWLWFLP